MADEKSVFSKLVIDEKETVKELEKLVEIATKIFRIEKPSGRIIFTSFGKLTDRQRILSVLVGKYFASKIGIIENSSLSISEIASELGRPMTTLSKPLGELTKQGFVESLPGRKYTVAYHRLSEIFEKGMISAE
jgi:DNA-binding transcriptional ArsR family regulator